MNTKNTVEVLQREIGITRATDSRPILATTNVAMCVAFHGFNLEKHVGFMCHFDFPFNTKSIPELAKKLSELTGENSIYKCEIHGGRRLTWARSSLIRELIKKQAEALKRQKIITFEIDYIAELQSWKQRLAYAFDTRDLKIKPYSQRKTTLSYKKLVTISSPEIVYEPKS